MNTLSLSKKEKEQLAAGAEFLELMLLTNRRRHRNQGDWYEGWNAAIAALQNASEV